MYLKIFINCMYYLKKKLHLHIICMKINNWLSVNDATLINANENIEYNRNFFQYNFCVIYSHIKSN